MKQAIAQKEAECLHKRKRSFIWPSLIALVLIIVGAVTCKNYLYVSIFFFVIGALSFPFAACLFLDNNFLEDMWFHVASFGVVKMPGVIMEFSIGGIIIGSILVSYLLIRKAHTVSESCSTVLFMQRPEQLLQEKCHSFQC